MNTPTVAMVCPYADRPEFIPQILRVFRSQTYEAKSLVIYDTGVNPFKADLEKNELLIREETRGSLALGAIRNFANHGCAGIDIIAHLDSDDWSHPYRLDEQVALLIRSSAVGVECVGYNKLLFDRDGEAWLYSNRSGSYAVGTSLCYWRKTWERARFNPQLRNGEDKDFITRIHCLGEPATLHEDIMMIARVHEGNARRYDMEAQQRRGALEWQRVPKFDQKIREILC